MGLRACPSGRFRCGQRSLAPPRTPAAAPSRTPVARTHPAYNTPHTADHRGSPWLARTAALRTRVRTPPQVMSPAAIAMRTSASPGIVRSCPVAAAGLRPARAFNRAAALTAAAGRGGVSDAPSSSSSGSKPEPFINVIPASQWANGIPPVMGAHLMASGVVAPVSTSQGAGVGVEPHLFQYPGSAGDAQVVVYPTAKNAAKGLVRAVSAAATAAIAAKGSFTLVLSGGSLVAALAELAELKGADWGRWWVFWADERVVPHSSPDSNYRGASEAFLGKLPIPASQVVAIQEGLPAAQAAVQYEGRLLGLPHDVLPRTTAPAADGGSSSPPLPVFDLVLLGVGPDGHVASLFPNAAATAATSGWVLPVTDSPKPPPERITLTLPAINSAKEVVVVALGEGKAEVVQRALECQALPGALPAQLVRPASGSLRWVLDALAAQNLDLEEWQSSRAFPRNE